MSIFAIGDTHLSFSSNKSMDIFSGWENYIQKIEQNWSSIVKPDDTVVIPGDISWAMGLDQSLDDFEFLEKLPGRKIILKGNHDYWWSTKKKIEDFFLKHNLNTIEILFNNSITAGKFALCGTRGWFFDDDSDAPQKVLAREVGRLKISLLSAERTSLEPIAFLHYPPITQLSVCEPIINELKRAKIARCYYGHLHSDSLNRAFIGEYQGIMFDVVSADYLRFCPKLIEKF
ncbi:MAG: metallophosphoesterase [Oscillospiraceae bacterium]|jgi:predicted phosphohydrolase|nr:metallophosphoesterase [Oscillospiraceae bacterium]